MKVIRTLKKNRERVLTFVISSSLFVLGSIMTVFCFLYLQAPTYPDTSSKGMTIIFAAAGIAVPALLGLLVTVYNSVYWVLNIHAPLEAICIVATLTSFVAMRNGIVTYDLKDCEELTKSMNSTHCLCRKQVMEIDCEELAWLQMMSYVIVSLFLVCLLLLLIDVVNASRKLCCTDEIPAIPGIVDPIKVEGEVAQIRKKSRNLRKEVYHVESEKR